MATSQNGWPVATKAQQDETAVHGVTFPHGVLAGDVATVLHYVADRFHREVEQLVGGTCWGWFVKVIEGSSSISNHASGTAIDLNADQHPMGVAASKTFTSAQIRACHAIVAACDGAVRWGGDYTGRPDPMHWEIVGSPTDVRALAKQIGEDMPTGEEIWKTDIIPNPKQRGDAATNPATSAYFAVGDIWQLVYNLRDAVAAQGVSLLAAVKAVSAKDFVDEHALAAELAPGIAAAVVAALPAGADITPAELQAAILGALKDLAAPAAS